MTERSRVAMEGVFVLHATPFDENGDIDFDGVHSNIDKTVSAGINGVVVGGTYAEFPSLRREERVQLFRHAVDAVAGRVPVVCCTAASGTHEAIELSEAAAEAGASAAMITPPYVHEVRSEDIVYHFESIAKTVSLPIMLYHSTSIGVHLGPELMARLAELDAVVAVKQGATDLHEQVRSLALVGERATMLCGSDGVVLGSLALGYRGCTTTLGNFMAAEFVELYHEMQRGEVDAARARFQRWQPLRDVMREVGQPAGVKAAMALTGYAAGTPRPPFRQVDASQLARVESALERSGLASGIAASRRS
jgi:4-hydroxy-tetrahydrodipicolinate synthase